MAASHVIKMCSPTSGCKPPKYRADAALTNPADDNPEDSRHFHEDQVDVVVPSELATANHESDEHTGESHGHEEHVLTGSEKLHRILEINRGKLAMMNG